MLIQIEALKAHIQKLNNSYKDAVVVVEGRKDAEALKPMLDTDFFILNNGKKRSLYETAEVLASLQKRAILMLDADKKGVELRKTMGSYLQMQGVPVVEEKKLLRLARARTVESLASVSARLL